MTIFSKKRKKLEMSAFEKSAPISSFKL